MDKVVERLVRDRALGLCEYCKMPESVYGEIFQIDHVISRQHGGPTVAGNLALCCPHCNLHKGPNLSGIDPVSGNIVPLFNPRLQRWEEHFFLSGPRLEGHTPEARAAISVLVLNDVAMLEVRAELISLGMFRM